MAARVSMPVMRNVHLMFTLAHDNLKMPSAHSASRHRSNRPYGKDKRGANRYEVRTPLEYRVMDGETAFAWKHGMVRNMSANGILIEAAESLANGCMVEAAMDWPGLYHGKDAMRLVLCGRVVRTQDRVVAVR